MALIVYALNASGRFAVLPGARILPGAIRISAEVTVTFTLADTPS